MNQTASQEIPPKQQDALDSDEHALRGRIMALPLALQRLARGLALSLVAFHVITSWAGTLPNFIHRSVHVAIALVLVYLLFGTKRNGRPSWHDYLSMAAVIAICANVIINYERIVSAGVIMDLPISDFILGALLIVIALETGRRTIGPALPIIAILFLL